ncbi:hypothetical protein QOK74_08445 [Staphylococcus saprophyticus]|nr:hypothetical protein [Staphylococcus saprophyticus]
MTIKNNKRFIVWFIVIFAIAFIYSFTLNDNTDNSNKKDEKSSENKSVTKLTKKDIDDMSDDKKGDIIFDTDKSDKLYEKNNKIYKYLYTKYFDDDYDNVSIPTENEINNMSDKEIKDIDPKISTKLSNEDKDTYDVYLDKETEIYASESDEDSDDPSDDDSTEELKDSIKSELNTGKIENVSYYNDSLGSNATIIIKGDENLSDKMTSDGMRLAVAQTVKAVKNSKVDLDDFTIDVTYPIDENGKSAGNQHVIKSKWNMDSVKNMSNDQLELLNTDLESFSESYHESSALK